MQFSKYPMQEMQKIARVSRPVGSESIKRGGPHLMYGFDRAYPEHYCDRPGTSDARRPSSSCTR